MNYVWVAYGKIEDTKIFRLKKDAIAYLKRQDYVYRGDITWQPRDTAKNDITEWDMLLLKFKVL